MNEELRHEIVRRRQGGASMRRIARDLGLARATVQSVLRRWQAERAGREAAGGVPARRPSRLDPYDETIRQLLARYPDITIVRVFQELRAQGFTGGLTVVRERVLELRPQPLREPVRRFETAPGVQAQMDYIREARFRERRPLGAFDWEFNRQAIDRTQIEELAGGAFIERQDNLVFVGQSGVGKSFLIQAIAEAACVLGYSVRYTTSADLLMDLTASLADQTLPERVRYYARFDLLVIDEFGFEKIERSNSPQAANLLYKVIDARTRQRATALVTNIDFAAWGDYLGDAPLAMAFLDRVVDGAIILKINGKSYRAHRASMPKPAPNAKR